jgi:hypothetical protein
MTFYEIAEERFMNHCRKIREEILHTSLYEGDPRLRLRVSKNAVSGRNSLPDFWTSPISFTLPIFTGFWANQRGPKSGQGKLADLDALAPSLP